MLAVGLAAVAAGVVALGASGDEPRAKAQTAAVKKSELPPLPKLRPKVVEPVAGDAGTADVGPDPGLEDAGPKPTAPASAGVKPGRTGHTDITKATALPNGIALPPLEAPEEVKQIIEAGNIIARSPYKWGGGHGKWLDNGYDCSGSVSFALAAAGPARGPDGLRAADELGQARQGRVGDHLRPLRPRVHGGRRRPVRHVERACGRFALGQPDALHGRIRRPPSGGALEGLGSAPYASPPTESR